MMRRWKSSSIEDENMEILRPADFEAQLKRKRKRVSRACVACRNRKTKCDRTHPMCSTCKLRGIAECIYEASPVHSNSNRSELKRIKLENEQLKKLLSAGEKSSSPQRTAVNDSLASQLQPLDMSQFTYLFKKRSRSIFYGTTSVRATAERYRSYYIDYFQQVRRTIKPSRSAWKVSRDKYLGSVSFSDDGENIKLLFNNLEKFLPSHATLRSILLMFFESLWFKFFPIIEKVDFMENFERVFSEQSDGGQKLLVAYKEADFSRIALVLLVLKLTLTFQYGGIELIDPTVFADSKQMLSEYIDKFLICARHMTRTSLSTLQTVFILRSIKRYDMSDGDGGDSSNGSIYVGHIIELALTLGLNRDIDSNYKDESDEYRATLKQLWRCIIYMDALNSYDLGLNPHISEGGFNPESINDGSFLFKTTIAFHKAMRTINAISITVADITETIDYLQKFHDENFDPIYTTIGQLYELQLGNFFPLLEKVILQTQILYVVSTLYYVLLKTGGPGSWRERNFVMSVKTGLLASLAWVDAHEIILKFNTLPLSSYIKNHISGLIFGMQRLFQTKFSFFNMFYYILEVDQRNSGMYKPYTDTRTGPPPRDITIKLSKWQSLEYDAEVDPYVFRDVFSINEILNRLYLRIFLMKKAQRTIFLPYEDPSFFVQWWFLKFSNNEFCHGNELEAKANLFKTNIHIEYDAYPINGFLDPETEKSIEKEMYKVIEWIPVSEASGTTNFASLTPGDSDSFFDMLLDDGGFDKWLV